MRTVRELRLAGLIAYLAALVSGLMVSGLLHLAFGGRGQFGWEGFNLLGLLEGLAFLMVFTLTLWLAKRAVRVTTTTLLSAGLFAPTSARKLARPVPVINALQSFEGNIAVLLEGGQPVGVIGIADSLVPWDEAPVVPGDTAASELGSLFRQHQIVFVADGNNIHGMITRERYFKYLGAP
ncbi:hypothetical protein Mlute_00264 [Meiothermus luteus]|jgi:hypothetical protein|uniref:CBS domain-containing protein n=1 Tax=Meiothermus luteus TaxID=2026184 RepID=A0A399F3A1_9DEIN|nr:hypothetical protein [Meiothermus luteus]RIH89749.1 hypothetical protein Mlute_00264 [Meiothermus luteus]RMH57804.1 MAG: hypothetical protein D6684_02370 [Deinococcota bacterium]